MSDSVLLKEELFTQIFTANSGEIKQIILFFIDVRLYQMIYKKQVIFQKRKTKKKKNIPHYSSLYIPGDSKTIY